jgi:hypothetical protein
MTRKRRICSRQREWRRSKLEMVDPTIALASPKISELFAAALKYSANKTAAGAQFAAAKVLSALSSYSQYLEATYDRVSTIKTFVDPSKPVSLLEHFVPVTLCKGNDRDKLISSDDLVQHTTNGSRIVISASAGYGKSVLMRYLALCLYHTPNGKIPIFVELRDLNRMSKPDLKSFIHHTYKQEANLSKAVFDNALEGGVFCLFLDGFDELHLEHRDAIQEQILEISQAHKSISIFMSSRPDPKFDSWSKFSTLQIRPMSLAQVKSLIEKIDYDPVLKREFKSKLNEDLYRSHRSFLSTPLLAILMMLTYEQNSAIPDQMHMFYLRAFEALFFKHDTYKERYERQRRSGLRIDEFSKFLSFFCINSYIAEKFEFTEIELIKYIEESISYNSFNIDVEDAKFDLIESVCIVQYEDQSYSFVHRSFQEYFTAVYLTECPEEFRDDFLDTFRVRHADNVLYMLYCMSKDRLDASYISTRAAALSKYLAVGSMGNTRKSVIARFRAIELIKMNGGWSFNRLLPGEYNNLLSVLSEFYRDRDNGRSFMPLGEVDLFCEQLCGMLQLAHVPFHQSLGERPKSKSATRLIELGDVGKFPISSDFCKRILKDTAVTLARALEVDEQFNMQQRLIAKLRARS